MLTPVEKYITINLKQLMNCIDLEKFNDLLPEIVTGSESKLTDIFWQEKIPLSIQISGSIDIESD